MVVLVRSGQGTEVTGEQDRVLDELRLAVAVGAPIGAIEQLPERCRRAVALAQAVGAPLLAAVEAAESARDDVRRGQRAVAVASAQTRTVAGGLLLAPILLVPGLARLVGADLLAFYSSRVGLLVLAVGLGLLALGAVIVVVLVRRVGRSDGRTSTRDPLALGVAVVAGVVGYRIAGPAPGLLAALAVEHAVSSRRPRQLPTAGVDEAADLVATALTAGVSGPEALRLAADALPAHATRLRRLAFGLELGMEPEELLGGDVARDVAGGPGTASRRTLRSDPRQAGRQGGGPRGLRGVDRWVRRSADRPPPGAGDRSALWATDPPADGVADRRAPYRPHRPYHPHRPHQPHGSMTPSDPLRRPHRPHRPQRLHGSMRQSDPLHRLAVLLAAAERVGAPVAPSVRHLARELRADDLARVLAAAERLPAQLTFPTALCLLPATVLLIGAPIVQTGLSAAGY